MIYFKNKFNFLLWLLLILLFILLFILAVIFRNQPKAVGASTTITLQPGPGDGKNSMVIGMPGCDNNNYAGNASLDIGGYWCGPEPNGRSYVEFSDLSAIPTGATIESATFSIYYYQYSGPTDQAIDASLHRVTSAWDKSGVTWNNQPSFGAAIITQSIGDSSTYGWQTFTVTSLVANWVSGSQANYGLVLSGVGDPGKYFYSSNSGSATLRPKLTVTYSGGAGPEPGPTPNPEDGSDSSSTTNNQNSSNPKNSSTTSPTPTEIKLTEEQKKLEDALRASPFAENSFIKDAVKALADTNLPLVPLAIAAVLSISTTIATLFAVTQTQAVAQEYLLAFINYIISLVTLKRRTKLGVVYDATTKKPLSMALVNLYAFPEMKLIASSITDKEGRLHFTVEKGSYVLSAQKRGFIFPSNFVRQELAKNSDIYIGQTLKFSDAKIINARIPLDPSPKLNEKKSMLRLIFLSTAVRLVIMTGGTLISLAMFWVLRDKTSTAVLSAYIVLWIIEFLIQYREVRFSRILNEKDRQPIDLAILRVLSPSNKIIQTYVSDFKGRVIPKIPQKYDKITVEKSHFEKLEQTIHDEGLLEGKRLYLKPE